MAKVKKFFTVANHHTRVRINVDNVVCVTTYCTAKDFEGAGFHSLLVWALANGKYVVAGTTEALDTLGKKLPHYHEIMATVEMAQVDFEIMENLWNSVAFELETGE